MAENLSRYQKVGRWALAQCRGTSDYKLVLGAEAKAETVTTLSAVALAKAEQLTHIVRVISRPFFFV